MIEAVMLWNEPNNLSHWDRSLDPEWALFAEMVGLAGERLGRVAPGLPRVLGGISPIDPHFVRRLFERGLGNAIDVVAVHGFPLDWNRWHLKRMARSHRDDPRGQRRQARVGNRSWRLQHGLASAAGLGCRRDARAVLAPCTERIFWYALMDLPERWEAVTRHRGGEGSAYYRHFRMGVCDADGQPKLAAARLAAWAARGVGVCEWVYWREQQRFERMLALLSELGIRRVRTGLGWADWDRPGAAEWFDYVMQRAGAVRRHADPVLYARPRRARAAPHQPACPTCRFRRFLRGRGAAATQGRRLVLATA